MITQDIYIFITLKIIPLLYAIVGFGSIIGIHEFGHLLFAKLFGIHVPTFSIGFGPELIRRKIGSTDFRLALIPLGGYCEIAGSAEVGQGEQTFAHATSDDSFATKPYWQQLLVMLGGILFNLLFAYMVFCSLFLIGSSDPKAVMVSGIVKTSAAEQYGLKPGDAIITVNNSSLLDAEGNLQHNAHEILLNTIKGNPNTEVTFIINRNNEQLSLPIVLGSRIDGTQTIGSLGAELRTPIQKLSFCKAIAAGVNETNRWIVNIVQSIFKLISQRNLDGAGGPVMIMSMSFGAAQHGIMHLLMFLALISINLALLNLLPIGALDGGQIVFVTIEALFGRKIPLALRNGINIISWVFFLSLAIFLTYKDIASLFGDKIWIVYKKIAGLLNF